MLGLTEKMLKSKNIPMGFELCSIYFLTVKSNARPPVSGVLTEIVPPCIKTAFLTIARPSPVPPISRLRPLSIR